jgi:hypothetical protein
VWFFFFIFLFVVRKKNMAQNRFPSAQRDRLFGLSDSLESSDEGDVPSVVHKCVVMGQPDTAKLFCSNLLQSGQYVYEKEREREEKKNKMQHETRN